MVFGVLPMLGPTELIIILVIVLMLFGAGKLPKVMKQLGESVGAFRRATTWLGLLLANHLVSAVDAFITTRLAKNGSRVHLESAVEGTGSGHKPIWRVGFAVDF